jgi:hypothetical protein
MRLAVAALAALLIAPAGAQAQDQPAQPTPPSWDTLVHCADMPDAAKELDCYRAAMKASGYKRNQQVVQAERHKAFGLELPTGKHEKAPKPERGAAVAAGQQPGGESEDRINVKIVEVAYTRPLNQLLIVTSDGGVWEQTDTNPLTFTPHAGDSMEINKTRFGGYFCKFDRSNSVRCVRKN